MIAIDNLDHVKLVRLVGFDRTLERGEVAVWQDKSDTRQTYVSAKDASLDTMGLPMGLRQAPMGTMCSVMALTDNKYKEYGSPYFCPAQNA